MVSSYGRVLSFVTFFMRPDAIVCDSRAYLEIRCGHKTEVTTELPWRRRESLTSNFNHPSFEGTGAPMLQKKSNSDHALALFKALLSEVGGGALASLLGDYLQRHSEKSIQKAMEFLSERVQKLEQRLDPEAVNEDDLAELYKSWLWSIIRSHRESKLKTATSILVNLLLREGDPEKLSYTELDHFARCVETLSSGALEVLGEVMRAAGTGVGVDLDTTYRMEFRDLSNRLPKHSPHLLMGLVAELDRANLLHCRDVPPIKTPDYGNYPVELTPLGKQFAQFLLT